MHRWYLNYRIKFFFIITFYYVENFKNFQNLNSNFRIKISEKSGVICIDYTKF